MSVLKRIPVPGLVGAGAVVWGLLLIVGWAIHPIDGAVVIGSVVAGCLAIYVIQRRRSLEYPFA